MMKNDPSSAKLHYDYPSNWTDKFGYYCDMAYKRRLGLTVALMLTTVTCFIILYLADILGRKLVMKISSIVIISGLTFAAFFPYFVPKIIGIGISGGAEGAFSALFTILINETSRNYFRVISQKFRKLR